MKILITGFFGEGNLGDEAILQAICQNLPVSCRSVVTSGNRSLSQASAIRRRGLRAWPEYLHALSECRATVFSGGILQDWSFEGVTFFALRILAAAAMGSTPTLWGAGIGPLRSSGARLIARKALRRVETAWLRDEPSVKEFYDLTGRNASFGADWSWFFPVKWQQSPPDNAPMALNLRQWNGSDWKNQVASQLRHNARHIVGLSARTGDGRIIKELAPAAAIVLPESFSDFADACRNISFGMAMRYHAALAMLRSGMPIKLIAYDSKVADLAATAGVLTLQQNQVADFRQARAGFCIEHEQRFKVMQAEFAAFMQKVAR